LAAEIAEGWLPAFFAPDHIDVFRPWLEEGAARAGRSASDIDIAPVTSIAIDDDVDRARDLMRPFVALYIGGMGSREKNFYRELVTRYGYGEQAQKIQDLYLDHKYDEAMAAIPAELIDKTALCGPKEAIAERLSVYRDAGVGTLLVTPVAANVEGRIKMLRELAELAA
jgi:alkanesulfonate monooxygenase SsuD/methylene tetrahydromethanopterin reductase-like flavin-dependent oxidoreductase (luciferase family)